MLFRSLHGAAIQQVSVAAVIGNCRPLDPAVRGRLHAGRQAPRKAWQPAVVPPETLLAWRNFGHVDAAAIAEVMQTWNAAGEVAVGNPSAAVVRDAASPTAAHSSPQVESPGFREVSPPRPLRARPDLSDDDACYVEALATTHAITEVVLQSPEQDLVGDLRRAAASLSPRSSFRRPGPRLFPHIGRAHV